MSEFQKPYPSSVTEEKYRRIFDPLLSCEGCFFAWKTKESHPCCSCIRPSEYMRKLSKHTGMRKDHFTVEYVNYPLPSYGGIVH